MNQPTPQVHWKVGVNAGEASNEMALPSVDGLFRGIGAVHVRGRQLKGGARLDDGAFEGASAFIVQYVQGGAMTTVAQVRLKGGEGMQELGLASGLDRFRQDGGRVKVIDNHDVLGAATGGCWESAGLVAVDLARHRDGGDKGTGFGCRTRWGVSVSS